MNDSNIRMTDQISKMNAVTVEALDEGRRSQKEYLTASSEYLGQIRAAQSELSAQMKTQQENLREFTEYMTQVLSRMNRLTEVNSQAVTNLQARADRISQAESGRGDMLTQQQLDRMIELLEAQEKRSARQEAAASYAGGETSKRRGFFSRG